MREDMAIGERTHNTARLTNKGQARKEAYVIFMMSHAMDSQAQALGVNQLISYCYQEWLKKVFFEASLLFSDKMCWREEDADKYDKMNKKYGLALNKLHLNIQEMKWPASCISRWCY